MTTKNTKPISQKQLEANKANAQKGGVKTEEGKQIVKYNALKHGLLAKEVVITIGEGAEDPEEFSRLLVDLQEQLNPVGTLEEMLVEKIAAAYWRLRRAYNYEVGLIRNKNDTAADNFYNKKDWDDKKVRKSPDEIEKEINRETEAIKDWEKDFKDLGKMYKAGKPLEDIFDWEDNWGFLQDSVEHLFTDERIKYEDERIKYEDERIKYEYVEPQELRELLVNEKGWTDKQIWERLIEICPEEADKHRDTIKKLEKEKQKNELKLQVFKKLGSIPHKEELDRLLRYESAIERQFYKALNQLERMQRLRSGDNVPPPVEVDVEVNTNITE